MQVFHIESGLGNQMLSYSELIALRKMNPDEPFYLETLVYDIPECCETIRQWNGYELDKVFGIQTPNVKSLFSDEEWKTVYDKVVESEFWKKNWNYAPYTVAALNSVGLMLVNDLPDRESVSTANMSPAKILLMKLRKWFNDGTYLGSTFKRIVKNNLIDFNNSGYEKILFKRVESDMFSGQRLLMKLKGSGMELIEQEVRSAFSFPEFVDEKNKEFAEFLDSQNGVFIHARRGDMLSANGWCYKYGYFKRAVKYMKKHVRNPVFVFFTDPGSVEWCKQNARVFGLDFSADRVLFVDWNKGESSFRDMQLMAHCKHGIITNSTFGWWGTFFITNPDKITISPMAEINTTVHC